MPGGYRLLRMETVDSTNAEALRLARAGEGGPLWIAARRQTDGRGRRGAAWTAPEGNLSATLLLPLTGIAPEHVPTLGFVAGLALVASGYASLDRGDLEGADTAAARASALLGGLDLEPHARVGAKVLLAQVLRRRGRLEEALAELDDALQASTEPALLFPRRQALSHRAGTLLDLGRVPEALEAARERPALRGGEPFERLGEQRLRRPRRAVEERAALPG